MNTEQKIHRELVKAMGPGSRMGGGHGRGKGPTAASLAMLQTLRKSKHPSVVQLSPQLEALPAVLQSLHAVGLEMDPAIGGLANALNFLLEESATGDSPLYADVVEHIDDTIKGILSLAPNLKKLESVKKAVNTALEGVARKSRF